MKNLICILPLLFSIVACQQLTKFVKNDPDTAQLTAKVAAWKIIEKKDGPEARSEEAQKVKEFIANGMEVLEKEDSVLISEFASRLSKLITTDDLSERALAELLIMRVSARLEEWADRQGLVGEERKVAVRIVLQAVSEAADVYILK